MSVNTWQAPNTWAEQKPTNKASISKPLSRKLSRKISASIKRKPQ
tara:strand:- start:10660 stop:10794 length:135 start_codon:yes stop_codon:yes gene_type:complete